MYLLLLPDAPKYTIISASEAFSQAMLVNGADIESKGMFDVFFPEEASEKPVSMALRSSLQQVLHGLKSHEMEVQKYDLHRKTSSGTVIEEKYWSPLNTPVFDIDGKLQYILHRVLDVTEKMTLEKERERFFTLGTDMLVVAGYDGYFKKVNPAWEETLGWTQEEMLSRPWIDFVHPDDVQATHDAKDKLEANIPIKNFENRYRCKDGNYRWLSWKTHPYPLEKLIYGGATDITERKKTEESLRASERKFRQLANAMPQVVWTAMPDGQLNYVNERCFEYSGTLRTENNTVDWAPIIHPEDLQHTLFVWSNCVASGKPYEVLQRIFHAASGHYRWNLTRALPVHDELGNVTKWYGTNTDIEDQKSTEDALRKSEQFNQSIIDSSPDCIKVLDMDGHLLSMNEEGCRQMEVDDFSVCINKPWIGFWDGVERAAAEQALQAARRGEKGFFQGFCATMKGTPRWWEVIVAPIRGNDGKTVQILSVSRDITERKKLEDATRDARELAEAANIAKSEFLANMSHEIRTPMNAVIGLANILAMSQPLSARQKEYIQTLQMSADSLLALINDLLDISKIEARSIELEHIPFNLKQLLNEVISMMSMRAKEKGLEFSVLGDCSPDYVVVGDPTRLRQILLNLCSNAIKFTEKGGVYVSIDCHASGTQGVENVSIAVRDSGIGISPEHQESIFHKFIQADSSITRKYGGTGLGLAITKTLTEIMGGTIWLTSAVGKGSTFTVKLPMRVGGGEVQAEANVPFAAEAFTKQSFRVLLVEDYAANVLVAGSYLEQFGYAYDVVDNGYDAVEKAKSGQYLAILMDVQMHGINGFETTRLIRAHEKSTGMPRVPILGMTAHALMGDRERCLEADMDDYLSKPYNPTELERKLAAYREKN